MKLPRLKPIRLTWQATQGMDLIDSRSAGPIVGGAALSKLMQKWDETFGGIDPEDPDAPNPHGATMGLFESDVLIGGVAFYSMTLGNPQANKVREAHARVLVVADNHPEAAAAIVDGFDGIEAELEAPTDEVRKIKFRKSGGS